MLINNEYCFSYKKLKRNKIKSFENKTFLNHIGEDKIKKYGKEFFEER